MNEQACRFFGVENPNDGMESHIAQAFEKVIARYEKQGYRTDAIVFSALHWHEEDAGTAKYLLAQSGL
ncbi:hypothetical protein, partial [Acinetobacter baumannii]|uniref:hypothetical protein n=1 Tax=Acinetobacter baumannii TaxID=470 RepID=UPI001F0A21A1